MEGTVLVYKIYRGVKMICNNFSKLFCLIFGYTIAVSATAQITFEKQLVDPLSVNSNSGEFGRDIKQTSDSGFIIMGSQIVNNSYFNLILNKTDKFGNVLWNKNYGNFGNEVSIAAEVQQTSDFGYVMVGNHGQKGFIIKTNNIGVVQWSKEIGNAVTIDSVTQFTSVQITSDGGYIVTGATNEFGTGGVHNLGGAGFTHPFDVILVRLNSLGVVQWTKTFGVYNLNEMANYVQKTLDGGFIIAGTSEPPYPKGSWGMWVQSTAFLIKINASGSLQWMRTYGIKDMSYFDSLLLKAYAIGGRFSCVQQTADSGYIAIGSGNGQDGKGAWTVKTDSLGNIQWNKGYIAYDTYFGTGTGYDIYQTTDRGYILSAVSGLNGANYYNQNHLIKTDAHGSVSWSQFHGTGSMPSLSQTNDGGYVFLGDDYNLNIIKTDSLGKNDTCQNTPITLFIIPTVITVPYTVTTGSGGSAIDRPLTETSFSVTVIPACSKVDVSANFGSGINCFGDTTWFTNSSFGTFFNWNFGDPTSGVNNTSTLFSPVHLYSSVGTHTVTLIVTDAGSSKSDTIQNVVTVVSKKFLTVGSDVTICSGDSLLLTASRTRSGVFLGWTPVIEVPNYFLDTAYVHPTTTTQYKAAAYSGCYDSDSLIVTIIPALTISTTGNKTLCYGKSVTLTASGGGRYLWSTGATADSVSISPTENTSYSVTVSNGSCSAWASLNVSIISSVTVNIGADATILNGENITLNGISGTWYPAEGLSCTNCPDPVATPVKTTTYYLTVGSGECTQTDSITIYVISCDAQVFVPSAFSPNSDGINDVLSIKIGGCVTSMDFQVYDRWGQRVFESDDPGSGWNGTFKSKELDTGVFVYYLKATSLMGNLIYTKGNIRLIR